MMPRSEPEESITLEGEDYNAIRRAEALAREEFCRPENRERRRQHFETLFFPIQRWPDSFGGTRVAASGRDSMRAKIQVQDLFEHIQYISHRRQCPTRLGWWIGRWSLGGQIARPRGKGVFLVSRFTSRMWIFSAIDFWPMVSRLGSPSRDSKCLKPAWQFERGRNPWAAFSTCRFVR